MSRYTDDDDFDVDFDAPLTNAEEADFKAWRKQRDAEAEARKPRKIDYDNTPDPRDEALKIGRKVVEEGGTEDDGLAAHVGHLLQAAVAGDVRVLPQYPEPQRY